MEKVEIEFIEHTYYKQGQYNLYLIIDGIEFTGRVNSIQNTVEFDEDIPEKYGIIKLMILNKLYTYIANL